jgi:hypothetical protein
MIMMTEREKEEERLDGGIRRREGAVSNGLV